MTFDPRKGIRAKQVFLSFCDLVRDGSKIAFSNAQFTANNMEKFWGAYYGDCTENSVLYSIVDLGWDGTSVTQSFDSQAYDTIASITTTVITLTTNTTMTPDALIGNYVIVKKADGKFKYARVTDNDASTITTDTDLATDHGVAGADTIILLDVPFGLTMKAFHRLDHIATDFSIEMPRTETNDNYFLGSSDSAGSQNVSIDRDPQTNLSGSVTIRGGVQDLLRLKYATDSSANTPTGRYRYNLGSELSENVAFTAAWASDTSDPDSADDIAKFVICNNVIITNVGLLDSVSSDGRGEASVEFEVKGADVRVEVIKDQANDADANI